MLLTTIEKAPRMRGLLGIHTQTGYSAAAAAGQFAHVELSPGDEQEPDSSFGLGR
jgi:hypothetical protein